MTKEIGRKLLCLRKNRGMTQQDVAEKVSITRSTVSNYEIGRRTPHLKDLQKLAHVFGVGLDYFGIERKDEAADIIFRAKQIFENKNVPCETKENLYRELSMIHSFYVESIKEKAGS